MNRFVGLLCILTLISLKAFGQISSDIRTFSELLNYKRSYNAYTKTSSHFLMRSALSRLSRSGNPSDVEAAIEGLGTDVKVCDGFLLEIVAYQSGGQEIARMICYKLCDNMNVSIRLVNYINTKYKSKISQVRAARIAQVEKEQKKRDEEDEDEGATPVVDQSNDYFYSQTQLDEDPVVPKAQIDSLTLEYFIKNQASVNVENRTAISSFEFLIDSEGKVHSANLRGERSSRQLPVNTSIFAKLKFTIGHINGRPAPYKVEYYNNQELTNVDFDIKRDRDGNYFRLQDNKEFPLSKSGRLAEALASEITEKGTFEVKMLVIASRDGRGELIKPIFIKIISAREVETPGRMSRFKNILPLKF